VAKGETFFKPGRLSFVNSIRDLLGEIHDRPGLWLGVKTLTGLRSLLFGYEIACVIHGVAKTERLPDDVPWQGFSDWLAERFDKVGRRFDWGSLLLEHSQSEEDAFDRFFALLAEYEARA
jgi:hypothetical protein